MQPRLTVLSLVLQGLGVKPEISTMDDRKRVQKAVYLAQRAGVDMGYRYNWYKKGPYSPGLTRDYYDLADALAVGNSENGQNLVPKSQAALEALRPLLAVPDGVALSDECWLELLASLDYLRTVSGLDANQVAETIREQKPDLYEYMTIAKQKLEVLALQ